MVIADRGYNRVDDWMAMAGRGVGLAIRYNPHGLKLHTAEGETAGAGTGVAGDHRHGLMLAGSGAQCHLSA